MIYLCIIVLLFYYAIEHDIKGTKHNKDIHFKTVFWIFFLLAGLRHGIGGDTYQFRIFWDLLPTWENATWDKLTCYRYDMGWVLLCFVIKSLLGSFVFLQLLLSWILNVGIFKVVKRYCHYPFVVLLLFFLSIDQFFHIECTFMRQAYAVAIFLAFGLKYLENRQYIKYILIIAICGLMHFSSVALIILPVFWNINWTNSRSRRKFLYTMIIFAVMIFVAFNYTPLSNIKGLLRFQEALENAGSHVESNELIRFFNVNYYLIIYYALIIWGHKRYNFSIPFKGAIYFGILIMLLAPYIGDFMRLIFFIIILIDISLSIIIVRISQKNVLIFTTCIILFTIGSNILNFQRYFDKENMLFIYPYYSWFEDEPQSHKKYFNKRINDGYTIPFQIYDANK